MKKRLLSILLAIIMVVTLLPLNAFAAESISVTDAKLYSKENGFVLVITLGASYVANSKFGYIIIQDELAADIADGSLSWTEAAIKKAASDAGGVGGLASGVEFTSDTDTGKTVEIPVALTFDDTENSLFYDEATGSYTDSGTLSLLVWSELDTIKVENARKSSATITDGKAPPAPVELKDLTANLFALGANKVYTGEAQVPEITHSLAAGAIGDITIKLSGDTGGKTTVGSYAVTIDVAEGSVYKAATGLSLSNWQITQATPSVTGIPTGGEVYSGAALPGLDGVTVKGVKDENLLTSATWNDDSAITGATGNTVTRQVVIAINDTTNYKAVANRNVTFTIKAPDTLTIEPLNSSSTTYTGSAISLPTPVVKANGTTLTSGMDYTGKWTDGSGGEVTGTVTNAGAYTYTVTSSKPGQYTGSPTVTYTVEKATASFTVSNNTCTYGAVTAPTVTVTGANGAALAASAYTVKYNGNTQLPTNAGSYPITVTINDTTNYKEAATGSGNLVINAKKLTAPTLTTATANSSTQITVAEVAGPLPTGASKVQYSKNGGTDWQDSNVFTGLTPNTQYSFVAKYVADDSGNYADSDAASSVSATTKPAPTYTVTVSSPTFNALTYGDAPTGQTVTVTNTGNQDGQTINLTLNSENFTLSKDSVTLDAGAHENITVTPKAGLNASETPYTATLTATNATPGATGNTATANLSVKVNQKELTIAWNTATFAEMTYLGKDNKTVADPTGGAPTFNGVSLTPVVDYERVSAGAGETIAVKATITGMNGDGASNYKLPANGLTNNNVGTVKVKPVSVSLVKGGITVNEKVYDGTNTATLSGTPDLQGVITGDSCEVQANTSGTFDSANAGSGNRTVTATYTLTGGQAGNYSLTNNTLTWTNQTIKKADLTVSLTAPTGAALQVDRGTALNTISITGTAVRAGSSSTVAGSIAWDNSSDTVTVGNTQKNWTFTPDNQDNYNKKTGTVTFQLNGIPTPNVTAFAGAGTQPYDGTPKVVTISTVSHGSASDFTVYYTGTNLTNYPESTTAPTDAGTYTVSVKANNPEDYNNPTETATLTISPKTITVPTDMDFTGVSISKTYDKTTGAGTLTGTASFKTDVIAGRDSGKVTLTVTAGTYTAADANANATANVTLALSGDAAKNYELSATATQLTGADGGPTVEIKKAKLTGTPSFNSVSEAGKTLADVKAAGQMDDVFTGVGGEAVTGSFAWNDGDSTEVVRGTGYAWTFTPDGGNYENATGSATPWPSVPAPGPGPSVSEYTVTYSAGAQGALAEGAASTEKVAKGEKPANVPQVVAKEGYKFKGWSLDGGKTLVNPADKEITGNVTFTAVYAEIDHLPYIFGRAPGVFAPKGVLNRAEAAAMLCRLTAGFDEEGSYSHEFTDVTADKWYYNYVGFAASHGIAAGYPDGSFRPEADITRGEFAAMIARYMGLEPVTEGGKFNDIAGYWGEGYINALGAIGAVDGYSDGGYHPNQKITREEAVKMINIASGRVPDKEKSLEGYENPFGDVSAGMWSYYDILEASVEHASQDFHADK